MFIFTESLLPLAYVNPGSGLLLLQLIIAGMVGSVFVFRRSIARIFGFGRKDSLPPPKDDVDLTQSGLAKAKTADPFPKN